VANPWKDSGGNPENRERDHSSSASGRKQDFSSWYPASQENSQLGVFEFLQKLETENAEEEPEPASPPTEPAGQFGSPGWTPHEVMCDACQTYNPRTQRYCGYCGEPLQVGLRRPPERSPGVGGLPKFSRAPADSLAQSDRGLEFLRSKAQTPDSGGGGWKYLLAGLALVLAGYGGFRWYTRTDAVTPRPAVITEQPPDQERGIEAQSPPGSRQQLPLNGAMRADTTEPPPGRVAPPEAAPEPASPTSSAESALRSSAPPPAATTATPPEPGTQELAIAERYLSRAGEQRDSAEAAKWLWKAIGKQNGRAVILLSDLYAHGDGVPQSCDQARLLLLTAAKKRVAEAPAKLRNLPASGCP
jgi:hypothetical protein